MFTQIGEPTDTRHEVHHKGGKITLLPANGTVHGGADNLGLEHIRQCRYGGGENGRQKEPLGPLEKLPE